MNLHYFAKRMRGTLVYGGNSAPQKVNQVIRHPHRTFRAVIVNVSKGSVSADACAFNPNYLLGVDLFNCFKPTVEG